MLYTHTFVLLSLRGLSPTLKLFKVFQLKVQFLFSKNKNPNEVQPNVPTKQLLIPKLVRTRIWNYVYTHTQTCSSCCSHTLTLLSRHSRWCSRTGSRRRRTDMHTPGSSSAHITNTSWVAKSVQQNSYTFPAWSPNLNHWNLIRDQLMKSHSNYCYCLLTVSVCGGVLYLAALAHGSDKKWMFECHVHTSTGYTHICAQTKFPKMAFNLLASWDVS